MFKDVAGSFVTLGDGHDPKSIPDHYGKYYDQTMKMFLRFGHYGGMREIHDNYWPMICLMADMVKRIDELEAKLNSNAYSVADDAADAVESLTYSPADSPKIDLRTKEGRAMRAANKQLVGA